MASINLIESFQDFKDAENIDRPTLMKVLEDVFKTLLRKKYGSDESFDVIVNTEKGDLEIVRHRMIVEDGAVENPLMEIEYSEAVKIEPDFEVGEELYEEVDIMDFGRRAILAAKQTLASRIGDLKKNALVKKYGDRVRMLNVSSSNFVSTSNVISNTTWGNKGVSTSFNTRINGHLVWNSPRMNGFEVGYSLRQDPTKTAAKNASLNSVGINWTDNVYYVGLAQEVHNDYFAVSGTASTAAAGSIYNAAAGLRSKDTGNRLTFGYRDKGIRIGADAATLNYTETSTQANGFKSHKFNTWQVTGEYDLNSQITLAAQVANNGAGNCTLNGAISCSTVGLGGDLVGFGMKYVLDRNFSIFALAAKGTANSGAVLSLGSNAGKTAIGGTINAVAVGINARF